MLTLIARFALCFMVGVRLRGGVPSQKSGAGISYFLHLGPLFRGLEFKV
jgi:hypothetical protein